jgi:hypothetical protein
MSKTLFLTIAGIAMTIACAALIYFNLQPWAALVGLMAYMTTAFALKTGCTKWKIGVYTASALVFGYSLCPPAGPYFMVGSMFCVAVIFAGRLAFFEKLGHSKMAWLEPAAFILAITGYIL